MLTTHFILNYTLCGVDALSGDGTSVLYVHTSFFILVYENLPNNKSNHIFSLLLARPNLHDLTRRARRARAGRRGRALVVARAGRRARCTRTARRGVACARAATSAPEACRRAARAGTAAGQG